MSRSRKLPILKDTPRNYNKSAIYWRTVRRVINDRVRYYREDIDDEVLPDPKEVVNDYDYIDYTSDMRFISSNSSEIKKDWAKRIGRK